MIKDYDLIINYHPGKANVVADALSRKSLMTLAHIHTTYVLLLLDMKTMGINLDYDGYGALIASLMVRLTLVDQIKGKLGGVIKPRWYSDKLELDSKLEARNSTQDRSSIIFLARARLEIKIELLKLARLGSFKLDS